MSSRQAVCPRCGASVDGATAGVLCDDCYVAEQDPFAIPDRLTVGLCHRCGSIREDGEWTDRGDRSVGDAAIDAVRRNLGVHVAAADVTWGVELEEVDRNALRAHVTCSGSLREHRVDETATVAVRLDRGTCDRCGRIAGDDFDATVQLRAAGRDPSAAERAAAIEVAQEFVADRIDSGDRDAFVTEIDENAAGVDLKVSTTGIGRSIADRIAERCRGTVSESQRLVTETDGEKVYRMAYGVRLPRFRSGDIIRRAESAERRATGNERQAAEPPVLVEHTGGDVVRGRRLDSGESTTVDVATAERVGSVADAEHTTLVTVEDANAAQILDPETLAATTVPHPDYLDPDAEQVRAVRTPVGCYILPDNAPQTVGEDV